MKNAPDSQGFKDALDRWIMREDIDDDERAAEEDYSDDEDDAAREPQ